MDRYDPARDVTPAFLDHVSQWLSANGEIFVVLRYLRAGGSKDFAFCRTFEEFRTIVDALPIGADIEVFRTPKVQVRGVIREQLIGAILNAILKGQEYLVLTARTRPRSPIAAEWGWGDNPDELRGWLHEHNGEEVAAGPAPDFIAADNDDLISASKGGIDGPR